MSIRHSITDLWAFASKSSQKKVTDRNRERKKETQRERERAVRQFKVMRRKRRKDHSLAPTSVAALVIALFFCFFFCFCISSSSLLSRSPKTVVSGLEQELRSLVTDFPRRWWPWWLLQWWNLDSGTFTKRRQSD